jgi:hypothetical protein
MNYHVTVMATDGAVLLNRRVFRKPVNGKRYLRVYLDHAHHYILFPLLHVKSCEVERISPHPEASTGLAEHTGRPTGWPELRVVGRAH